MKLSKCINCGKIKKPDYMYYRVELKGYRCIQCNSENGIAEETNGQVDILLSTLPAPIFLGDMPLR
jgi:DNA-directed RNA polymerase subunit RPC12/RpoP